MKPTFLGMSLCLVAVACLAQFRSEVHLINIGFSVRDPQGRLVTNLTQDDFEIVEDGVPQKISFFARSQDVPLTLGLVVDISGSQGAFVKQHHQDVRKFLNEVLRDQDRAFLVCFANNPRLVSTFSASGKKLVDALEGFQQLRDKSPFPLLGFPEIRTGRHVVLRRHLLLVGADAGYRGQRPPRPRRLQRRRRQFQRAP